MAKTDTKQQQQETGANQNKPKFQQTRLCFAPASSPKTQNSRSSPDQKASSANATDATTARLEKSIKSLNIGNKRKYTNHCNDCKKNVQRIQCTAYKENSSRPCTNEFCVDCIKAMANEDLEWIQKKKDNTTYVYRSGRPVKHRPVLPSVKWACLACRGLCDCELCKEENVERKTPRLAFNIKPSSIQPVHPPELRRIDLLCSPEELWARLQIREFIFRFGDLYDFDYRILSNLQNAQGDWKIKRLGAYVVWLFLTTLSSKTSNYDLSNSASSNTTTNSTKGTSMTTAAADGGKTIPQRAQKILNDWIAEKKLSKYYVDSASRQQALLEILFLEGMSGKRWQELAELLAYADMTNIPVPTSRDIINLKDRTTDKYDDDAMDIDDNDDHSDDNDNNKEHVEEMRRLVERYRKAGRNTSLLSSENELKMIQMLLDLLLFDSDLRQSLTTANTAIQSKSSSRKRKQQLEASTLKDLDLEFKKYHKEHSTEELKNKNRKNTLNNRLQQLKMIRGKEEEVKAVQTEIEELETLMRDERMSLESKKIELAVYHAKARKRLEAAGRDHLNNEYWLFSDLIDHLNYTGDYRNSEPYWAYGVVIIGPGFHEATEENEEEKGQQPQWWFVKGRQDLTILANYLKQQAQEKGNEALAETVQKIHQRLEYLTSLECAVYGEGFFSS